MFFKDKEEKDTKNVFKDIRQGILNKILFCDYCLFHYSFFGGVQEVNEIWNNEKRIKDLIIRVNRINAFFDNVNLNKFMVLINFIIKILNDEKFKQKVKDEKNDLLYEITSYGPKEIENDIYKKIKKINLIDYSIFEIKTAFSYEVKEFNLKLLTKNIEEFLEIRLENFIGKNTFNPKKYNEMEISVKKLVMKNLLVSEDSQERNLLIVKNKSTNKFCFMMKQSFYHVNGFISTNKWKIYQNFEFIINPIEVNFTTEIFDYIYKFFFYADFLQNKIMYDKKEKLKMEKDYLFDTGKYIKKFNSKKKNKTIKKEELKKDIKKNKIKKVKLIPHYFINFKFHELEMILNYKTTNILMNLKNAKFKIQKYEQRHKFSSMKDIFDLYSAYVKKEVIVSFMKYKFNIKNNKIHKEENEFDILYN